MKPVDLARLRAAGINRRLDQDDIAFLQGACRPLLGSDEQCDSAVRTVALVFDGAVVSQEFAVEGGFLAQDVAIVDSAIASIETLRQILGCGPEDPTGEVAFIDSLEINLGRRALVSAEAVRSMLETLESEARFVRDQLKPRTGRPSSWGLYFDRIVAVLYLYVFEKHFSEDQTVGLETKRVYGEVVAYLHDKFFALSAGGRIANDAEMRNWWREIKRSLRRSNAFNGYRFLTKPPT